MKFILSTWQVLIFSGFYDEESQHLRGLDERDLFLLKTVVKRHDNVVE
jgi:hypothetical protein